jgi:nucleotide-binding universal stress UspA family protein
VIVATDGSASTIAAAGRALQVLGPGVDVEVVTVGGADDSSIVGAIPGPGLLPPATPATFAGAVSDTLSEVAERTVSALGLGSEGRILYGSPGAAICRRAEETGADVIVVHPHGKRLLERALMGSVTRYLVDNAPCAVLVAR